MAGLSFTRHMEFLRFLLGIQRRYDWPCIYIQFLIYLLGIHRRYDRCLQYLILLSYLLCFLCLASTAMHNHSCTYLASIGVMVVLTGHGQFISNLLAIHRRYAWAHPGYSPLGTYLSSSGSCLVSIRYLVGLSFNGQYLRYLLSIHR